jgi:hypothetical protein
MPVEAVIPSLRSVVEDAGVLGIACSQGHKLFEWKIGKLGARDQLIRVLDVRSVVLAVMKAQRLGGNDGLESVLRIRKRR